MRSLLISSQTFSHLSDANGFCVSAKNLPSSLWYNGNAHYFYAHNDYMDNYCGCQEGHEMNDAYADALNQALRVISIRHRARAAALLAELGLYPGQEVLLLAAALGCEPPSVTQMARKLEAAGLISRRTSPHDNRATIVELTAPGRALIPSLKAVWRRLAESTLAGLITTAPEQLLATVEDLARSLSSGASASELHRDAQEQEAESV
jgi:DNA-binding MarR family transcriptional regulator